MPGERLSVRLGQSLNSSLITVFGLLLRFFLPVQLYHDIFAAQKRAFFKFSLAAEKQDFTVIWTVADEPEYVEKLLPVIDKDCIITDVGSTKYGIYRSMQAFDGIKFIAGHPMAGSEKTGFSAANEHLYENAYYILTPTKEIKAQVDKNNIVEKTIAKDKKHIRL